MLLVPLLQVRDHGVSARRYQNWLVAVVLHSLTMIIYTYKDQLWAEVSKSSWILFFRYSGPSIVLIVSFASLMMLVRCYAITEVAGVIVTSVFMSYLMIVLTDMCCLKNTITLEIMLIPLTVRMHTLRFVGQGSSTKIEAMALLVAILGVIPGIFYIITLGLELSENGIHHVAFKIATLLGAIFRFLDIMFICCDPIRDMANYFRCRLQECFI
ncbi:hypothetical protein PVAP13_5NG519586 [Panicum virgatum]|uniref:Uncharacterized protein n=1 Tax=Panicum virgatum TaxID=38727 RepID=A0A8T0S681_PANVG|nr:hypothetical protein PVAP13_5NG519586 [Panicum virgatum]